jgi:hypothetical protein
LKTLSRAAALVFFAAAIAIPTGLTTGCGKKDVNADLKPVSPDAPRPKLQGDGGAGKVPGEKAPSVIK